MFKLINFKLNFSNEISSLALLICLTTTLLGCNNLGNTPQNQSITPSKATIQDKSLYLNPNNTKELYLLSLGDFKQKNKLVTLPNFINHPLLIKKEFNNSLQNASWFHLTTTNSEFDSPITQMQLNNQSSLIFVDDKFNSYVYYGYESVQKARNLSNIKITAIPDVVDNYNFVGTMSGSFGVMENHLDSGYASMVSMQTYNNESSPIVAVGDNYAVDGLGDFFALGFSYNNVTLSLATSIHQSVVGATKDTSNASSYYLATSNTVYHIYYNNQYIKESLSAVPTYSGFNDAITSIIYGKSTNKLYIGTFLGNVYEYDFLNNNWVQIGDSINYTMITKILLSNNVLYAVTSDGYNAQLNKFEAGQWVDVTPNKDFYQFSTSPSGILVGLTKEDNNQLGVYRYYENKFNLEVNEVGLSGDKCEYVLDGNNFESSNVVFESGNVTNGSLNLTKNSCNSLLKDNCQIELKFHLSDYAPSGNFTAIVTDGVTKYRLEGKCSLNSEDSGLKVSADN